MVDFTLRIISRARARARAPRGDKEAQIDEKAFTASVTDWYAIQIFLAREGFQAVLLAVRRTGPVASGRVLRSARYPGLFCSTPGASGMTHSTRR